MKKIFFLCTILLSVNCLFAQNIQSQITEALRKSGLYSFSKEDAEKEQKPFIEFFCTSKNEFTRKTIAALDKKLLETNKEIDYKEIKKMFQKEVKVFGNIWNSFSDYKWKAEKRLDYSIMYSQKIDLPINGAGIYVIRIFEEEYVYTIRLTDYLRLDEPNKEYDVLSDIFEYRKGQKADAKRGLEQTQGYFCDEKSAARFYEKLRRKDSSLPKTALRFQEAEDYIEKVLDNY